MSKRSRIVRRRMRAHENWLRFLAEMPEPIVFPVTKWTVADFNLGALIHVNLDDHFRQFEHEILYGQPTEIHDIELKSASLDGMNFLYHPRNPNP